MAMQQPVATGACMQPQAIVMNPPVIDQKLLKVQEGKKRVLKALGIVEVVLGVLIFILGCVNTALFTDIRPYSYRRYGISLTYGEGIWGGIWIIVAGGLGIGAAQPSASRCLINTHMGFSIYSSVVSGALMIIGIALALLSVIVGTGWGIILNSITAVLSFATLILLIISACYCCSLTQCCNAQRQPYYGGQVTYYQQQPTMGYAQGYPAPHGHPTTYIQTSPPNTGYHPSGGPQPPTQYQVVSAGQGFGMAPPQDAWSPTKEQEAMHH